MNQLFVVLTASSGFVTAILWSVSATAKILDQNQKNQFGLTNAPITEKQGRETIDFIATVREQAKWNKKAAFASAVTAVLQILVACTTDAPK